MQKHCRCTMFLQGQVKIFNMIIYCLSNVLWQRLEETLFKPANKSGFLQHLPNASAAGK